MVAVLTCDNSDVTHLKLPLQHMCITQKPMCVCSKIEHSIIILLLQHNYWQSVVIVFFQKCSEQRNNKVNTAIVIVYRLDIKALCLSFCGNIAMSVSFSFAILLALIDVAGRHLLYWNMKWRLSK